MNKTYEDMSGEIETMLLKHKAKWQLNSLAWIDYDDVSQIIRLHIYQKWHLWDQSRSFGPWVSAVISNRMTNLIRDYYGNLAKPCLKCPYYMGGNECSFTVSKEQDLSCKDFAKWKKKKEHAYNLKLPISLDSIPFSKESSDQDQINYEEKIDKIHKLVMMQLNEKHQKIYQLMYIENVDEKVIAEKFGFKKDTSKRRTPRYKQINNLKKKFYEIALKIIQEQDLT